jgi:putative ABC transport system substrate-binding protein
MKRREFIAVVAGAVAFPLPAFSQQTTKTYRIAYLALAGAEDAAFIKERFRELGYREGET